LKIKNDYQKYYTIDELEKENSKHYLRVANTCGFVYKGKTVLDVGAGVGTLSKFFKQEPSLKLTAIEINHSFCEYLKTFGINVIEGDAVEIMSKMGDNSFDIIVMGELVEHFKNPGDLLKQAFRVAKERVIFSLPRRDDEWHYWNCNWVDMQDWIVISMDKKDDTDDRKQD